MKFQRNLRVLLVLLALARPLSGAQQIDPEDIGVSEEADKLWEKQENIGVKEYSAFKEAKEEDFQDHRALDRFITFEENTENENLANFSQVSEDMKVIEKQYETCLKAIDDLSFDKSHVEGCIGENFIKVILDLKYETLKVMAQAHSRIEDIFVELCYTPAGTIEEFSVSCDFMEHDTLDLLWNGLDFIELLEINQNKYIEEYGTIPVDQFMKLMDSLQAFANEFFQVLNEVDDHKEKTILFLKSLIEQRINLIKEREKMDPDFSKYYELHGDQSNRELRGKQFVSEPVLPPLQFENESVAGLIAGKAQGLQTRGGTKFSNGVGEIKTINTRVFNNGGNYKGLYAKQNRSKLTLAGSAMAGSPFRHAQSRSFKQPNQAAFARRGPF